MILHIFNPEHDMALAANMLRYTPSEAARRLGADLDVLPAIWAQSGDAVLVTDEQYANRLQALPVDVSPDIHFITTSRLSAYASQIDAVEPWGWDRTLRQKLVRSSISSTIMPSEKCLEEFRKISHRAWAATRLLPQLVTMSSKLTGHSLCAFTEEGLTTCLKSMERAVLKMPWSSSGRGIIFLSKRQTAAPWEDVSLAGRLRNILQIQGSIMVEPYYEVVANLAMEFFVGDQGSVTYVGLSVFHTFRGAYQGSVVDSEEAKIELLSSFVAREELLLVRMALKQLLETELDGRYIGPLGVDMMIVKNKNGYLLHPCVELNLRNTMGHLSLHLIKHFTGSFRIVSSEGTFCLVLTPKN